MACRREGKPDPRGSDSLSANGLYVVGRHPITVTIIEMSPQVIHDGGNLIVAHHRSE
jgi:hypothetical protein